MSGGSPDCMTVVSLVLKASFSSTWISMVTFGCRAMYSSAIDCQRFLCSSAVEMCHQVTVTGSATWTVGTSALVSAGLVVGTTAVVGVTAGAQAASASAMISTRPIKTNNLRGIEFSPSFDWNG